MKVRAKTASRGRDICRFSVWGLRFGVWGFRVRCEGLG